MSVDPPPPAPPPPVPPPTPPLGPWLRRADRAGPAELVTTGGTIAVTAADWLRLVRQGLEIFAPELRALGERPSSRPSKET